MASPIGAYVRKRMEEHDELGDTYGAKGLITKVRRS